MAAPAGPERLTRDHVGVLDAARWSIEVVEEHPEWLEAQLDLYGAALALPLQDVDDAVNRLRGEAEQLLDVLRPARRLIIVCRHPG